jgi:4-aminobutyrate aminotransferase
MGGVVFAPFPHAYRYGMTLDEATDFCLRELDELFVTQTSPCDTAAMMIEPVQGEYGYWPATTKFMQGLRERCDKHNILLIADEVQAGFGRTGKFWSFEHFGITPDIIITAKGLASGFPVSAIAASQSLMEKAWPGSQGGTYGANAVACAGAVANIDVIREEKLVDNAKARGEQLRAGLEELMNKHDFIDEVRGMGLMQGLEIVDGKGQPDGDKAAALLKASEEEGLLLLRCGTHGQVVRWLPPLIVTEAQVNDALEMFTRAIERS